MELESEQVNQLKDFEERQMAWQDRESALLRFSPLHRADNLTHSLPWYLLVAD
jgi:hypothetical protein